MLTRANGIFVKVVSSQIEGNVNMKGYLRLEAQGGGNIRIYKRAFKRAMQNQLRP